MNTLESSVRHGHSRRGFRAAKLAFAFVLAALLASVAQTTSYAQEAGNGSIQVTIEAPAQVKVGEAVTLQLRLQGDLAEGVTIGGFEAQLLYTPSAGEFAGFAPPPPGDEGIGQLVVPETPTGSVVGYYTCGTEPCLSQREAQAQAAAEPGLLGQVQILALTASQLEIKIGHLQVVDRSGKPIAVTLAQPGIVVTVGDGGDAIASPAATWNWSGTGDSAAIASATAADVTQDGEVGHSDVMEVALAWEIVRESGAPCDGSEANSDINGDGCVDIVDVQTAAAYASGDNAPTPSEPHQFPQHLFLPQIGGGDGTAVQEAPAEDATEDEAQIAAQLTFTVNSTLDEYDAHSNDNKCLSPSGVCTLRAAIQQSINHAGPELILFDIPGSGVQTIQLGSRLPSLWDTSGAIVIDGYSQPGAMPNTDPLADNAVILIQVRGNGYDAFDGLAITSSNNVVKGLSFFNLKRSIWIYGSGAQANTIVGDFIGTDATGAFGFNVTSSQQAHGVHVEQGAAGNHIGGAALADRNVISGNARHGIGLWHTGSEQNVVINNIVGLSPDGKRRLSNRVHGVDINFGASYNFVGGLQAGEGNVISGNNGSGAEVSHENITNHNTISGNFIGTNISGTAAGSFSANGLYGISVKDRVVDNVVEGNVVGNNLSGGINVDNFGNCCTTRNTVRNNRVGIGVNDAAMGNALFGIKVTAPQNTIGPGNIIANNPVGLEIESDASGDDGNRITQNSIFANTGLGIDIAPIGQVNLNDDGDADSGPNEQLNYPLLNSAMPTLVTGQACANCTIEVFLADSGANVNGEGRTLVGTATAAGDGSFAATISGASSGQYVTATATDSAGNTSEFSLNRVIVAGAQPWEQVFAIPGRIEAENYRVGGQGTGYSDTTAGNSGRVYRSDDVDIEVTKDVTGSYDIGWVAANEWLSYDVNVAATGNYQLVLRVGSASSARRVHIEIDGVNVSGPITIPWTGGYQVWANVTATVPLTAGTHVLRFVAETDKFNVNYFDFTAN